MNEHLKEEHSHENLTCQFCGKEFDRKQQLQEHLVTHQLVRPSFPCQIEGCGKEYLSVCDPLFSSFFSIAFSCGIVFNHQRTNTQMQKSKLREHLKKGHKRGVKRSAEHMGGNDEVPLHDDEEKGEDGEEADDEEGVAGGGDEMVTIRQQPRKPAPTKDEIISSLLRRPASTSTSSVASPDVPLPSHPPHDEVGL